MRNTSSTRKSSGSTSANQNGSTDDEVDEAGWAERVFEPRAQRGEMAVRPVLDRDPQPQGVFDREHDEREKLDR